jgi:PDZ domain-containing protein
MRRRGVTVLVGVILVVGLFWFLAKAPVPYAEYVPGPTFDTLGQYQNKDVIEVTGVTPTKSKGQLRFLTVGVLPQLTMLQALVGWWRSDDAVIPVELVIPPGQTEQQVDQANHDDFVNSESAATTAAYLALGVKLDITVTDVTKASLAEGKLQVNDIISGIDGQTFESAERMIQYIRSKPVGSTLTFSLIRDKKPVEVKITTVADENKQSRVGFLPTNTPEAPYRFNVTVENVGGPSAGLMLTLGMIDKIEPEDLTGGKIIAGTGTIDAFRTVGPIGGIQQKIVAAKDAGAQYFLTPADNCSEAVGAQAPGLPLVRVANLDDALNALSDIRAGKMPPVCPGSH